MLHRDPTAAPFDEPDHLQMPVAGRHAVDDRDLAIVGRVHGFENERAVPIATLDPPRRALGSEQPAPMTRVSEDRREARARIEPRERQPVDRSITADERRRLQVGEKRVLLDPRWHGDPRTTLRRSAHVRVEDDGHSELVSRGPVFAAPS